MDFRVGAWVNTGSLTSGAIHSRQRVPGKSGLQLRCRTLAAGPFVESRYIFNSGSRKFHRCTFVIWKGPIVDISGKEQLKKDEVADDKFLGGVPRQNPRNVSPSFWMCRKTY